LCRNVNDKPFDAATGNLGGRCSPSREREESAEGKRKGRKRQALNLGGHGAKENHFGPATLFRVGRYRVRSLLGTSVFRGDQLFGVGDRSQEPMIGRRPQGDRHRLCAQTVPIRDGLQAFRGLGGQRKGQSSSGRGPMGHTAELISMPASVMCLRHLSQPLGSAKVTAGPRCVDEQLGHRLFPHRAFNPQPLEN
jgi:hypothetical protein